MVGLCISAKPVSLNTPTHLPRVWLRALLGAVRPRQQREVVLKINIDEWENANKNLVDESACKMNGTHYYFGDSLGIHRYLVRSFRAPDPKGMTSVERNNMKTKQTRPRRAENMGKPCGFPSNGAGGLENGFKDLVVF